jgi:hypothetical protein
LTIASQRGAPQFHTIFLLFGFDFACATVAGGERMGRITLLQYLVASAVWVAVGIAVALPLYIWGSDKAPEFYGAFTAAIVAAIAVILGSYYQAELARKRDAALYEQERTASALDLLFWIENAADEMNFIAEILTGMRDRIAQAPNDPELDMPLERFRESVSAKFMNELPARAHEASQLPAGLAEPVTRTLYQTSRTADRIWHLRGASAHYRPRLKDLQQHILVAQAREKQLRMCARSLRTYLFGTDALAYPPEDEIGDDSDA